MRNEAVLYKVAEAKQIMNLGETTIWALIARGELPVIRIGRAVRIRPEDIQAWIQRKAEEARHESA